MRKAKDFKKERDIFAESKGVLKTTEAIKRGIHPRRLYLMAESGYIQKLARGLYRLSGMPQLSNPDLITICLKVPKGVVSLISSLAFHNLTTQIPHEVYIALPKGARQPAISYPPARFFRFYGKAFAEGIETHEIDGISIRVYSPEKSLADCFKFRNVLGMDTVLEALRNYLKRKNRELNTLIHYAEICRVYRIMRPYIESAI